MHYFGLQTRSLRGGRGRRRRGRRRSKKKEKKIQGMDSCIHDFGMIFVQEFLGHDC